MKCTAILRVAALVLACGGILIPTPLLHAAVAPKTPARAQQPVQVPRAVDVSLGNGGLGNGGLGNGGVLSGQVVDSQGTAQAKLPVSLIQLDRPPMATVTDQSGNFTFTGLRGGTYQLVAGRTHGHFRLWAPGTAPPSARNGALLVVGKGPIRAQQGPIGYWLGNPWVVAGLVAAAIVIPVAIHNHQVDKNKTPASD